ncbi:photosystem II reaction center protein Psb28 [Merismopedia glauca]|uniref:Photosystem II reaction center Psb28 protein n=1 Tax=Merismopedia glauca CCAP 1448/3 TaxID=1296344 RepID=A0A2T1C2T0_9CYAN|nr:photosystem II reaction center protein Psb28 [Merismopedia glauca]PSB02571.1 photosystem II reaction center protein Psb28 [Merismopedia glauca CCAP 1448/3]
MSSTNPVIEFFQDLPEELSNVSLRKVKGATGRRVVMIFKQLQALERFNSFTKQFSNSMRLVDEEGEITIEPDSVQFRFTGPEGDELDRVEVQFDIDSEDHWDRFMRFMHRYAEANGMAYGETER